MELEPEDAQPPFPKGPYFSIAFLKGSLPYAPLNCTRLLHEWTLLLDPIDGIRQAGGEYLRRFTASWIVDEDRYLDPDYDAIRLLRLASRDELVVELFRASPALIEFGSAVTNLSSTVDEGTGRLNNFALPVLFGLAVASVGILQVANGGRWLAARRDEERRKQAERDIARMLLDDFGREILEASADDDAAPPST